jgi:integrase
MANRRYAPLSPKLVACLMKQSGRRIVISPYVFPSSDGKKPADIEGAWDHVIRRARLPYLRFHDLRHTAASYLAMSGATTIEIAAVLDHKTLAMVKRYSHMSTAATTNALKKMHETIGVA